VQLKRLSELGGTVIALVALAPLAAGGERTGEIYGSPLHWPGELWAAFALAGFGQLLFGMPWESKGHWKWATSRL
jgi:hypothetical protein